MKPIFQESDWIVDMLPILDTFDVPGYPHGVWWQTWAMCYEDYDLLPMFEK